MRCTLRACGMFAEHYKFPCSILWRKLQAQTSRGNISIVISQFASAFKACETVRWIELFGKLKQAREHTVSRFSIWKHRKFISRIELFDRNVNIVAISLLVRPRKVTICIACFHTARYSFLRLVVRFKLESIDSLLFPISLSLVTKPLRRRVYEKQQPNSSRV